MSDLLTPKKPKAKTYRVTCLSTAVSPITHMSGTQGNEAVIMREPAQTADGLRWVPVLSGNALRHRLIRGPGARFLIESWGLGGSITLQQLNFLFHGGTLRESSGRISTERLNRLYRLFPLLRLLGCSLPNQIVSSSLYCQRGTLVCRENADRLAKLAPEGWLPSGVLRSATSFVEGYQYFRGDAQASAADLLPDDATEDAQRDLMIFAGQCVVPGAKFLHGFLIRHGSELELGALLLSLRLWADNGASIGGQAARGHGQLRLALHLDDDGGDAAVEAYVAHVVSVKDEAVAFLGEIFDHGESKPKRGKKTKAAADAQS